MSAQELPYVCWRCGASIEDHPRPLARAAECRACRADLHVCLACEFHDTAKAKHCREPIAEEVKDKTRANFCDYFKVRPGAHRPAELGEAEAARAGLEALFGAPGVSRPPLEQAGDARAALDRLFGKD